MLFKCGHEWPSGVGANCSVCHKMIEQPKKTIGRPVTKTEEEKQESLRSWKRKNRLARRKYHREYGRLRYVPKKGAYVIYNGNGGFWLRPDWVTFYKCRVYCSMAHALKIAQVRGGTVIPMLETKEKTLSSYLAQQIKDGAK